MNSSSTLRLGPLALVSRFSWIAIGLVSAHFLLIVLIQGRPLEPLTSGLLELAVPVFAATCCFHTGLRTTGNYRTFWLLAGCTFAFWSAGELLDIINEFYLGNADPNPTALLFVFFVAMAPIALGIFRITRHRNETAWIWFLDGVQVFGVLLVGILFTYVVGGTDGDAQPADNHLQVLYLRNLALSAALIVRSLIARSHGSRRIYAPLALAFSFYTLSSWLGNHAVDVWGFRTGSWSDLTWSIPFAIVAMTAAEWRTASDAEAPVVLSPNTRCAAHLLTEYILPVLLPVAVIGLALFLFPRQPAVAALMIAASFGCFIARLCVTQWHRERLIHELKQTLNRVKIFSGLLPICAGCKMIRDGSGAWHNLEIYIKANSDADFTHGICPECTRKFYPDHVHSLSDC